MGERGRGKGRKKRGKIEKRDRERARVRARRGEKAEKELINIRLIRLMYFVTLHHR